MWDCQIKWLRVDPASSGAFFTDHNGKQNAKLEQAYEKLIFLSELRSKGEPVPVN